MEEQNNSLDTDNIVSLIQIKPGPKTEIPACYFYNRTESDGQTRFVSYHFSKDSKDKFIDLGVNQIINKDIC